MWIAGPPDLIGAVGTTVEFIPSILGPDGKMYHNVWNVALPAERARPPAGRKTKEVVTLDAYLQPIRPPAPKLTVRKVEEMTA